MDRNLALDLVRVTEAAALASARRMGGGDGDSVDQAAVEALHRGLGTIAISGTVVVGEGHEDGMELLFTGEQIGAGGPIADVAVDALEGPSSCAMGSYNAVSAIAIADRGTLLRVPDTYMEKLACGPEGKGVLDLDQSPTDNLKALAEKKGVYVQDLTVAILDRPRHQKLIAEVRAAGARIRLIPDGDLQAALATTNPRSGIDLLLGVGRAPQGVLAAAALTCLGGEIQARLKPSNDSEVAMLHEAQIHDVRRKYTHEQLASGSLMFAATGVTAGDYLRGVRFVKGGAISHSVVMRSQTRTVRFIEAHHRFDLNPDYDPSPLAKVE